MINVAVIGLGNMGKHHARNYAEMAGVSLVAVCDLNEELAINTAKKFSCRHYNNYMEMLEKESIQAVSIVVPTNYHKEVALACIGKGIHILVEKPIAGTISDAEKIISSAQEKGVILQVGHVERFNPAVQKLKEVILQGKLGEVTSIIARRVGAVPIQVRDANVVIDLAVHDIDIINYLYDSYPEKVSGNVGKAMIEKREDYAEIFMQYGRKSGFIQVNWITPVKIRNLTITGSKGYAELNYLTQELIVYESNYTKEIVDEYGDYVIKFGIPDRTQIGVEQAEPLYLELRSFITSVQQGVIPQVTGEMGLQALRIALEVMGNPREYRI
ncbi:MAG TPA: Gfo/Idh/MocA family oxidoreductase [Candidatus Nanoarchaeia archaeon]|nr:Gfo/Idh/MocA family oxidoreductase [Candidatus Nanoarchaeia archaeon]